MAFDNVIGGGSGAYLTNAGVTAAGTTQATATTLVGQDNEVTTVTSGSGVVVNPLFAPGETCTVYNATITPLKVYPPSGLQINTIAANGAMTLPPNTGVFLRCISATRIYGVLSA